MDDKRLNELSLHGIQRFSFSLDFAGKRKAFYFGTARSAMDLYALGSRRKRCSVCGHLSYKWQGSSGYYACYDGCFSTTGHDSRTPDGWPQWIERKKAKKPRRKKVAVEVKPCSS